MDFFMEKGGLILFFLSMGIAAILAGIGSALGVRMTGEALAGITSEEPEKFGKGLVLQLLPGTQGLYGFVIALFILTKYRADMPLEMGISLILAACPIGIVGWISAIAQARAATAGMAILVKKPDDNTKGIIIAAMVETYAILSFILSMIMVSQV